MGFNHSESDAASFLCEEDDICPRDIKSYFLKQECPLHHNNQSVVVDDENIDQRRLVSSPNSSCSACDSNENTDEEEIEDISSDALNFAFDLFDDNFETEDSMDVFLEDWISTITAQPKAPSSRTDCDDCCNGKNSQVISPPASRPTSPLPVATIIRDSSSMEKLDECMKRTNESRRMVLKLMPGFPNHSPLEASGPDKQASQPCCRTSETSSSELYHRNQSGRGRGLSSKLRKSLEPRRRSQKNTVALCASFKSNIRKRRRIAKKGAKEFVCSGVAISRIVSPTAGSCLKPVGSFSAVGTRTLAPHRPLSHTVKASTDEIAVSSISSFLRQYKRW